MKQKIYFQIHQKVTSAPKAKIAADVQEEEPNISDVQRQTTARDKVRTKYTNCADEIMDDNDDNDDSDVDDDKSECCDDDLDIADLVDCNEEQMHENTFNIQQPPTKRRKIDDSYDNMTVAKLKGLCRDKGLYRTGNKQTLITRLRDLDNP